MSNLQEVATEDLLNFQDYPQVPVHHFSNNTTISIPQDSIDVQGNLKITSEHQRNDGSGDVPNLAPDTTNPDGSTPQKSFWTIEYYQKYFDVDTKDVVERIMASVIPKWDSTLKHHLRTKPDLYGPFWISVTLIFTIAISGNFASYLQHANENYHWRYNFHLVSYAATTICLYVTMVPFILWGLLKYTSQVADVEGIEDSVTPGVLELICIYGYSLFIYIPVSVLWSIQISLLQWILVLLATFISGSVLLLTLIPALRLSTQKLLLIVGIVGCHLLLAAGFMLYFFHVPTPTISHTVIPQNVITNSTKV